MWGQPLRLPKIMGSPDKSGCPYIVVKMMVRQANKEKVIKNFGGCSLFIYKGLQMLNSLQLEGR